MSAEEALALNDAASKISRKKEKTHLEKAFIIWRYITSVHKGQKGKSSEFKIGTKLNKTVVIDNITDLLINSYDTEDYDFKVWVLTVDWGEDDDERLKIGNFLKILKKDDDGLFFKELIDNAYEALMKKDDKKYANDFIAFKKSRIMHRIPSTGYITKTDLKSEITESYGSAFTEYVNIALSAPALSRLPKDEKIYTYRHGNETLYSRNENAFDDIRDQASRIDAKKEEIGRIRDERKMINTMNRERGADYERIANKTETNKDVFMTYVAAIQYIHYQLDAGKQHFFDWVEGNPNKDLIELAKGINGNTFRQNLGKAYDIASTGGSNVELHAEVQSPYYVSEYNFKKNKMQLLKRELIEPKQWDVVSLYDGSTEKWQRVLSDGSRTLHFGHLKFKDNPPTILMHREVLNGTLRFYKNRDEFNRHKKRLKDEADAKALQLEQFDEGKLWLGLCGINLQGDYSNPSIVLGSGEKNTFFVYLPRFPAYLDARKEGLYLTFDPEGKEIRLDAKEIRLDAKEADDHTFLTGSTGLLYKKWDNYLWLFNWDPHPQAAFSFWIPQERTESSVFFADFITYLIEHEDHASTSDVSCTKIVDTIRKNLFGVQNLFAKPVVSVFEIPRLIQWALSSVENYSYEFDQGLQVYDRQKRAQRVLQLQQQQTKSNRLVKPEPPSKYNQLLVKTEPGRENEFDDSRSGHRRENESDDPRPGNAKKLRVKALIQAWVDLKRDYDWALIGPDGLSKRKLVPTRSSSVKVVDKRPRVVDHDEVEILNLKRNIFRETKIKLKDDQVRALQSVYGYEEKIIEAIQNGILNNYSGNSSCKNPKLFSGDHWFKQSGAQCGYQAMIMMLFDDQNNEYNTREKTEDKIVKNVSCAEMMDYSQIREIINIQNGYKARWDFQFEPEQGYEFIGLILHNTIANGHWIAVRYMDGCWYNLDSFKKEKNEAATPLDLERVKELLGLSIDEAKTYGIIDKKYFMLEYLPMFIIPVFRKSRGQSRGVSLTERNALARFVKQKYEPEVITFEDSEDEFGSQYSDYGEDDSSQSSGGGNSQGDLYLNAKIKSVIDYIIF